MIEVSGLFFDYSGHRALNGVDFHIEAGSVTALVGPNGAGKSTLLRCLAGLDEPLVGQMRVAGIDVREHPRAVHSRLGYLSDFFGLYEELTVWQFLHYAAAAQGMAAGAIDARVTDVLHQLGLTDKRNVRTANLSRGQRQRVAIGQAIVHQPQVLLLDEPASGLDPEARTELSALFRQLAAQGMTLVVSSHILSELDEYCTHILSLRNGRITGHSSLTASGTGGVDDAAHYSIMALELAGPAPQLEQVLQPWQVVQLDASGQRPTTVRVPRHDRQARVQLLATLVQAGVPVCSFAEQRTSVQDSYARLRGAQAPGADGAQAGPAAYPPPMAPVVPPAPSSTLSADATLH